MNNARNIAISIIAAAALAIFSTGVWRVVQSRQPHVDVERDRYPVMGVDLSAHNGDVDFERVAAAGVDFVFLKASEGTDFRDPKFISNYNAARKAGIKVGAYHFFRFDSDGYRQGRNFLTAVDSLDLDLPLAIDIEDSGNPTGHEADDVASSLRGMIFALEGSRNKVILYTNKKGYDRYVRGRLDEMPVWLCSFTNPPISSDNWLLWQHSHRSHIDGISGEVDMNTFNGDSISWSQWLNDME